MSDQHEEQYDPASTEGLPEHGRERLQKMKAANFFTSDLSVNEFLLVKEAGFDPLGLVIGSSIYHVGYQRGQWNQNQEMDVLSQAMYHARELAMTRMEEEADQLGADGGLFFEFDPFGQGENAEVPNHFHQMGDHLLVLGSRAMDIVDQRHVEF